MRRAFLEAGVAPESIDVCISNCVVNLSPRKDLVLKSVFDVLKWGGTAPLPFS